jgi:hypothetical protein
MRVEPLPVHELDRPHWAGAYHMQDIEIFVRGEGHPTISLLRINRMPPSASVLSFAGGGLETAA